MTKKNLTLSLTAEQYVALIDEAQKANLTLSEYARRRIFGHRITPRIPQADVQAIALLKQIGGLLKQLWKSQSVDPEETQVLLNQVKMLLHQLQVGFRDRPKQLER